MVQFKDSLINSLINYPNLENLDDRQSSVPANESIPVIIGAIVACILLVLFFICLAYYMPWWCMYKNCCHFCVDLNACNCVYCFFTCPCMNERAKCCQKLNIQNVDRMFIQDFLTTVDGKSISDGRIIQLSNLRSANKQQQHMSKSLNSINVV